MKRKLSAIIATKTFVILFSVLPAYSDNNAGQAFSVWHDTGETSCYDTTSIITCPTSGANFYGQDTQYSGPTWQEGI